MKSLSPELMLIPYGWAAPEDAWPDHAQKLEEVVVNVSKKLNCPVIGTDLVGKISHGPWTGQVYGGQSIAVNKNATVIGKAKDRDRDIVVVKIEL
jgi:predicted amidohydrolase